MQCILSRWKNLKAQFILEQEHWHGDGQQFFTKIGYMTGKETIHYKSIWTSDKILNACYDAITTSGSGDCNTSLIIFATLLMAINVPELTF